MNNIFNLQLLAKIYVILGIFSRKNIMSCMNSYYKYTFQSDNILLFLQFVSHFFVNVFHQKTMKDFVLWIMSKYTEVVVRHFQELVCLKTNCSEKLIYKKKYVLFIPVIFNRHVNLPKRNEHIKTRKTPIPNIKINLFNFNFSTEILDEDFIQAKLLKIWKIINIIIYEYYFYKIDVQKWTKI